MKLSEISKSAPALFASSAAMQRAATPYLKKSPVGAKRQLKLNAANEKVMGKRGSFVLAARGKGRSPASDWVQGPNGKRYNKRSGAAQDAF